MNGAASPAQTIVLVHLIGFHYYTDYNFSLSASFLLVYIVAVSFHSHRPSDAAADIATSQFNVAVIASNALLEPANVRSNTSEATGDGDAEEYSNHAEDNVYM